MAESRVQNKLLACAGWTGENHMPAACGCPFRNFQKNLPRVGVSSARIRRGAFAYENSRGIGFRGSPREKIPGFCPCVDPKLHSAGCRRHALIRVVAVHPSNLRGRQHVAAGWRAYNDSGPPCRQQNFINGSCDWAKKIPSGIRKQNSTFLTAPVKIKYVIGRGHDGSGTVAKRR